MNKNLTKLHDDMNVLFRKSGVIVVSAYGSQALMVYSNEAGASLPPQSRLPETRNQHILEELQHGP